MSAMSARLPPVLASFPFFSCILNLHKVNFGEFLALELIRLNKTNMEQVLAIRKEFMKRDVDKSGDVAWKEIRLFQKTRAARCLEIEKLVK